MSSSLENTIARLETMLMLRPDDAEQRVNLGRVYHRADRLDDAERAYQTVLRKHPTFAGALYGMGLLRSAQAEPDAAFDFYRQAIAADADHVGARRALGEHAANRRQWAEAWQHYEQLVALRPDEAEVLRAAAAIQMQLGGQARACELLLRADDLEPTHWVGLEQLCSCLAQLERWDSVIERALPRVDSPQVSLTTVDLLGLAGKQQADLTTTERAFRTRLQREKADSAQTGLAWALIQRRAYAEALDVLEAIGQPSAETLGLLGQAHFESHQLPQACDSLSAALALEPGNGDYHRLLGLAQLKLGKLDEAVTHLRHATRYQPNAVSAWTALALGLTQLQQLDSATEPLKRAVELEPDNAAHYARLAEHQTKLGQPALAIEAYARACELAPDCAEYWLGQGHRAIDLELLPRAERCLLRASHLAPADAAAAGALGHTRLLLGQPQAAVPNLEQAVHQKPDHVPYRLWLADAFFALGRAADAELALVKLRDAAEPEVDLRLGEAWFAQQRYEEATPILKRCVASSPECSRAWCLLGVTLDKLERPEPARDALQRGLELSPNDASALQALGDVCLQLGQPSDALDPLLRLARLRPHDLRALRTLGRAQLAAEQFTDARTWLEQALSESPKDAETLALLGETLARLDKPDQAVARLQEAIAVQPRLESAQRLLAQLLEAGQRCTEAITHWDSVLNLNPKDRTALSHLARLHMSTGDANSSLITWRRLLVNESDDIEALFGSAQALITLQRTAEAVPLWKRALRLAPQHPEETYALACACVELGDDDEAQRWLHTALELSPTAEAWDTLAACHERNHQPSAALDALESAVLLDAERPECWRRLGFLALQLGKRPRGVEALEHAFERGVRDAALCAKLAECYRQDAAFAATEERHTDAVAALQLAARFHSEDATLHAAWAEALIALGKPHDALLHARRATILQADSAAHVLRLGRLLHGSADHQAAKGAFSQATQLDPSSFEGWVGLSQCEAALGFTGRAIDALSTALALKPDATAQRRVLGELLMAEHAFDRAGVELERVWASAPLDADTARRLALCLEETGQLQAATRAWKGVLRVRPDADDARLALGRLLLQLNEPQEAIDPLEHLRDTLAHPPTEVFALLGRALYAVSAHEEAVAALTRATAKPTAKPTAGVTAGAESELLRLLADSLCHTERFESCLEHTLALLTSRPHDAELLRLQARALAGLHRFEEASTTLQRIIRSPQTATDQVALAREELIGLHRDCADRAQTDGRYSDAANELRTLCQWCPDSAALRVELVRAVIASASTETALNELNSALGLFPTNAQLVLEKAVLLEQIEAFEEACAQYQFAINNTTHDFTAENAVAAYHGLGRCLSARGQTEPAHEALTHALGLAERSSAQPKVAQQLREQLAQLVRGGGSAERIVEQLRHLAEQRELNVDELRDLAAAQSALGQFADAVETYQLLLDEVPSDTASRYALAMALRDAQRTRASMVPLRELVRLDPQHHAAWLALASGYAQLAEHESACAAFKSAIDARGSGMGVAETSNTALSNTALSNTALSNTALSNTALVDVWLQSAQATAQPALLLRALDYACQARANDARLGLWRGQVLAALGQRTSAIEQLNATLRRIEQASVSEGESDADLASLKTLLAQQCLAEGKHQRGLDDAQARLNLCAAAEHSLHAPDTLLSCVQALAEFGAVSQAIQFAERATPTANVCTFVGQLTFKREEYARSAAAFERALTFSADHQAALVGGAQAHVKLGQHAQAEPLLSRALQAEPNAATLIELKEQCLNALGRVAEAVDAHQRLLQLDPGNPQLHARYVQALAAQARHEDVVAAVNVAESHVAPDAALWGSLLAYAAYALSELGRYREGVAYADRSLELDAHQALAQHAKGVSLLELGEAGSAEAVLRSALDGGSPHAVAPHLARALVTTGEAALAAGAPAAALDKFEQAMQLGAPKASVLLRLLDAARQANRIQRAVDAGREWLQSAVQASPATAEVWLAVGQLELQLSHAAAALDAFEHARAGGIQFEALLGLGLAYSALNDDAQTLHWLTAAIAEQPHADAYSHLAALHTKHGREREALRAWLYLQDFRALTFDEQCSLGQSAQACGELDTAARAYAAALQLEPHNAALWIALSKLQLRREQPSAAVDALRRAADAAPSHTQVHGLLGRALAAEKQPAEAIVALQRQLQYGIDVEVLTLLAEQQALLGDANDQLQSLLRLAELSPNDAEHRAALAAALSRAGRHDEALTHARRAVTLDGSDAHRLRLAQCLLDAAEAALVAQQRGPSMAALSECHGLKLHNVALDGRVLSAALALNEAPLATRVAAALLPHCVNDPRLYVAQARAAKLTSDWAAADVALERATDLLLRDAVTASEAFDLATFPIPRPEALLAELSEVREHQGRLLEAAATADRAVRLGLSQPAHTARTARLLCQAGQDCFGRGVLEQALSLLQRSDDLQAGQSETQFMLALTWRAMGNATEAIEAARGCLDADVTHAGALRLGADLLSERGGEQASEELLDWFARYSVATATSPELSHRQAQLLLDANRHEAARGVLWTLNDDSEFGFSAYLGLARSFQQTSDLEDEISALQAAARKQALPLPQQERLAAALKQAGRLDEAAALLGKLQVEQGNDLPGLFRLARAQTAAGRHTEALATLQRIVNKEPTNVAALRESVAALTTLGRENEAIAPLQALLTLDPQPEELERLADMCLKQQRKGDAAAALHQWAHIEPHNARAHLRSGLVRMGLGHHNAAIDALARAYKLNPGLDLARERLIELLRTEVERTFAAASYPAALAHVESLLELVPSEAQLHYRYARCLSATDRGIEAVSAYQKALACDPTHEASALALAAHIEAHHEPDRAELVLGRALRAQPASGAIALALTRHYVQRDKLEQAAIVGQRARALMPNHIELLLLLCTAAANTGHHSDAADYLQHALSREPNNDEVHYNLGKLYLAMGHAELAHQQLDKLRSLRSPRADKLAARLRMR